jgi:hypothetical protein
VAGGSACGNRNRPPREASTRGLLSSCLGSISCESLLTGGRVGYGTIRVNETVVRDAPLRKVMTSNVLGGQSTAAPRTSTVSCCSGLEVLPYSTLTTVARVGTHRIEPPIIWWEQKATTRCYAAFWRRVPTGGRLTSRRAARYPPPTDYPCQGLGPHTRDTGGEIWGCAAAWMDIRRAALQGSGVDPSWRATATARARRPHSGRGRVSVPRTGSASATPRCSRCTVSSAAGHLLSLLSEARWGSAQLFLSLAVGGRPFAGAVAAFALRIVG